MGRFSPIMKLTCHGIMMGMQSYLRPSQGVPCHQWRTMCSDKWSCSLSLIRIKFCLKTASYLAGSNGELPVYCSLVQRPHLISCRLWLGRKVCQWRCSVSSAAEVRIVGLAKSQLGAAARIRSEEPGRYGIDESDYADVMTSPRKPQRPQSSDKHEKRTPNPVSESKDEKGFDVKQNTNPEETRDLKITESNDDAKVESNNWCTYIILSSDKQKTYLGVTANLTRRLRQHNGEIAGGAKAARGFRPWSLVCTVRGFANRSEACQFEWRLRKISKGYLNVYDSLFEEIPIHYQGSHVILRRWAAFKKIHETTDGWKHVQIEWY